MNLALWKKSLADARTLLVWMTVLLFGFSWLFVWLSSQIELPALHQFLVKALPREWEGISGVPFSQVATPAGRVALVFVHPIIVFGLLAWSVARGSDCVAGELSRGTLEMILAQPVSRTAVYVSQAVVTTAGSLLLCTAVFLGIYAGVSTVKLPDETPADLFFPPTLNLFGVTFFIAGFAALVSAWENYRWRVIGIVGGFWAVSLAIKLVARMAPKLNAVGWVSFLSAFEPQAMVGHPEDAAVITLQYNGILIGLGLLCYIVGAVIFCRRDLPAPL